MASYEYSYSSSTGGSGALSGGYTVEYSTSSASGGDAYSTGAVLLGASNAGLSSGTVLVGGGGLSGASGNVVSYGGSYGAAASSGAAGSNATVNQIASDLLALNAGGAGGAAGAGGSYQVSTSFSSGGGGAQVLEASAFSQIEQAILRANNPVEINETETITINGQTGIWANRAEVVNWRGVIPITQYLINEDANPEIIRKRTEQQLIYEQEVAIRYLRPPTPPPPGEILIKQEKNIITPPAPPLIIRQQPARPETPAPLVIREAPPRPPGAVGQKVITISGKRLPPPPRKVIIERLAPLPSKPQSVIIERWLPYNQQKRRVIFTKPTEADPVIPRPRNVIIQWESPSVQIKKEFKDLGVIRANPVEYVQRYGATLKSSTELPDFVREIRPPTGVVLASEYSAPSLFELEGDVQALTLIDLEREGLAEYRAWLSRLGISGSASFGAGGGFAVSGGGFGVSGGSSGLSLGGGSSTVVVSGGSVSSLVGELFASVDRDANGKISRSEAEKLLLRLNSRLGRSYGENEVNVFFRSIDVNADGLIDFEEFRNAILRFFA